ncbi:hypothetical protein HGRIS_003826 [Hohenbuehelia grisea]|uniref:Cytochrome P450 n=1 Tax=Hohenbuehelia grisea TaxID=104357 RepID=A0ABR3JHS2_9AGAR
MGWDFCFAFREADSVWKEQRKLFYEYFRPDRARQYSDAQRTETHAFLRRLLNSPQDFLEHTHHLFGSALTKLVYGIAVKESKDPYVEVAEEAVAGLSKAIHPGKYLVDIFPALKHIPVWMPGAGFRKTGIYFAALNEKLVKAPFEAAEASIAKGEMVESIVADMVSKLSSDPVLRAEQRKMEMHVAATAYAAGADTTVAAVQTFFLLMAMHPEVQKRAQAELDTFLGVDPDRLPDFSDRGTLPYIEALVSELLRWNLVVPASIPHASVEDDLYEEYFIPKGTLIIANVWTLSRDPIMYPEPDKFIPERFLKNGVINNNIRDPRTLIFGFGRRICPGRH